MRLPFIHRTAASVYVTDTEVVWAQAVARIRQFPGTVTCEREPITDGRAEAALQRLVDRVRPAHPYVVTHLDALHIRHAILQGPAFDDTVAFDAWLQAEAVRQLPPRANLSDFALCFHLLEEHEDYTRCLLALTSRKAVEQRSAFLKSAGLQPIAVVSTDLAIGALFMLNEEQAGGQAGLLLLRPQEAVLLQYQQGFLQSIVDLPYGVETTEPGALLQEVGAHLVPLPERFLAAGYQVEAFVAHAQTTSTLAVPLQAGTIDLEQSAPLPEQGCEPAVAMALQYLWARDEALNFLAPDEVYEGLQELEKREATRSILWLGSVMGLCFLLLTLAHGFLQNKVATTNAVLSTLGDKVARIDEAHTSIKKLERDIAQAERLVVERTNVAEVLQNVGHAVMEGLWLDRVALEEDAMQRQLTLTGATLSETDMASFLDRLEQAPMADRVQLLYSENVRAPSLYKNAEVKDKLLTRFEIQISLQGPQPGVGER